MGQTSSNTKKEQVSDDTSRSASALEFFSDAVTPRDLKRLNKRRFFDRFARVIVNLGGWFIISIIVLLITVLLTEVLPLFSRPTISGSSTFEATQILLESEAAGRPPVSTTASREFRPLTTVLNSEGKVLTIVYRNGIVAVFQIEKEPTFLDAFSALPANSTLPNLAAGTGRNGGKIELLKAAVSTGNQRFSIITDSGILSNFSYSILEDRIDGKTVKYIRPKIDPPVNLNLSVGPVRQLTAADSDQGELDAVSAGDRDIFVVSKQKKKGLIASSSPPETKVDRLTIGEGSIVTSSLFIQNGRYLAVGTNHGDLLVYDVPQIISKTAGTAAALLSPPLKPASAAAVTTGKTYQAGAADIATPAITVLATIGAGRNILIGDARGAIYEWGLLPGPVGRELKQIRVFSPLAGAINAITVSNRTRIFSTLSDDSDLSFHHSTSGKTVLRIDDTAVASVNNFNGNDRAAISNLAISPRADRIFYTDYSGKVISWIMNIPYPEITFQTLFQKVWYEDYPDPQYVWQSGGGSDLVEPKFSLIPLIFGTFKGTLYAMLLSIPLAFVAALYTSQFLDPKLRNWIKPAVELMAAVPSVVVGLIAGLWLAPRIESVLAGLFFLPLFVPLFILTLRSFPKLLPARFSRLLKSDRGILGLIPLVAAAIWIGLLFGPIAESAFFAGDMRRWITETLGLTFDQRNCIVVGIAMGFAVIPLIYTVAEDVLSSVPRSLVAGSLALGASRWETAFRIVLPTASPGLFAAAMLGLGRAIGETMIVLMATGNTPILSLSPFNGFRALSANVAVELPEAPVASSLYRVLFLTALLLFFMTFVINTLSEFIRIRLRRRYDAG